MHETRLSAKDLARFESGFVPEALTGCWIWIKTIQKNGYGVTSIKAWPFRAHRISYAHYIGPIPLGFQIDHVKARGCTTRSCVNPDHLEAVTLIENLRRGNSIPIVNGRKTHCKNGHEFTPENTAIKPLGRECRKCDAERAKRVRAAKRLPDA